MLVLSPAVFCDDTSSTCFALYGDSHRDDITHARIVSAIIDLRPKAVFHMGDFVDHPLSADEWVASKRMIEELITVSKFYLAIGNHDESHMVTVYFDFPEDNRWYSVEFGNCHFTILDSNINLREGSQQYEWLESDLKGIGDNIKFRIVVMHHPIFSTGFHGMDSKNLRDTLVPLFERYKVDMVFSGHDHGYERSRYHGIYYIITSGGTEKLYGQVVKGSPYSEFFLRANHFCTLCVTGDRLTLTALDLDGNTLDEIVIDKRLAGKTAPQY